MPALRMKRAYLATQGLLVLAWWVSLIVAPQLRGLFQPTDGPLAFLFAFLPPDILMVSGGSIWAALRWRTPSSPPAQVWIVAGALWFTTIYLVGLWYFAAIPATGPVLMVMASLGTAWAVISPLGGG